MNRIHGTLSVCVALLAFSGLSVRAAAVCETRAEEILQEIDALDGQPPYDVDKASDYEYAKAWSEQKQKNIKRANELTLELYRVDPTNPRLPELLDLRWYYFDFDANPKTQDYIDRITADIDKFIEENPSGPIWEIAVFNRALVRFFAVDDPRPVVNEFVETYPKAKYAPKFLEALTTKVPEDEALQIRRRIVEEYPDYENIRVVRGALKRSEALAERKQMALKFDDALSGETIDTSEMQGKVVLVTFWATWCGPCKQEIPALKTLYGKYHEQGLEIIGVSADKESNGGKKILKAFVEKAKMPWPQCYQGDELPVSYEWGVDGIPALFFLDKQGRLDRVFIGMTLETTLEKEILRLLGSK